MEKALRKYLERHAEPEARAIGQSPLHKKVFGHIIVIPAYGEDENLFQTLKSIPESPLGPVLAIVVVNGSQDAPAWVHEKNEDMLARLALSPFPQGVFVIDRASPAKRFPEKQGVGLARKIGCDMALALQVRGMLRSRWIHTTDADALLPPDYFLRAEAVTKADISALLYPFRHRDSEDASLNEASRLYELHLQYYVEGLRWAGSPYAFHTLGSTLALCGSSYAEVGGFPRRMAGEDFYLLNKIAKVGRVESLIGDPILLESRLSDRVPFGTGPAFSQIMADRAENKPYHLYHPQVFDNLKLWLSLIEELVEYKHEFNLIGSLKSGTKELKGEPLFEVLSKMEAFEAVADAVRRSHDPRILRRHLHTWFDGFRTLKFIHALRDQAYPSLPWEEALSKAPFMK